MRIAGLITTPELPAYLRRPLDFDGAIAATGGTTVSSTSARIITNPNIRRSHFLFGFSLGTQEECLSRDHVSHNTLAASNGVNVADAAPAGLAESAQACPADCHFLPASPSLQYSRPPSV
jgi:hypothetical protein